MANFCKHCGEPLKDAKFCPNCGKAVEEIKVAPVKTEPSGAGAQDLRIAAQSGATAPAQQDQPAKPARKKKGSRMKTALIVLGGIFIFMFVCSLFETMYSISTGEVSRAKRTSQTTASVPAAGSSTQSANTPTLSDDEQAAAVKKAAEDFDATVWSEVVDVMEVQNNLMSASIWFSEGRASASDLWDACKTTEEYLALTRFPDARNADQRVYRDSCEQYAVCVQMVAQSLMKYMDDPSAKNGATLQENISLAKESAIVVAQNRGVFLKNAGFTEEEIKAKADEIQLAEPT